MAELPEDVREEAERLTRLARDAVDPAEADAYRERRESLLSPHGYTARVRDDDVLVLHPGSWLDDDGVVRTDRIDDLSRGIEVDLDRGGGDESWETVEAHNADIVETVAAHGPLHAANARAFADYLGNHYLCRVEEATAAQLSEFLTEYYPRNGFASPEQKEVVEQSLELVFEAAGVDVPDYR